MKKYLLMCLLVFSLLLVFSCSSPEKSLLSKYFHAVQMKDNTTLSNMAVEPVTFVFTDWKVKEIKESKITDTEYSNVVAKIEEIKQKQDVLKPDIIDVDSEYEEMKEKRGYTRQKAELKKQRDELYDKYRALQEEKEQYEEKLTTIKNVMKKSLGQDVIFENVTKKERKDVIITVKSPTGSRDYRVELVRYYREINGQERAGYWKILRFVNLEKEEPVTVEEEEPEKKESEKEEMKKEKEKKAEEGKTEETDEKKEGK